ncbi:MAG: type II toxin-antitoxin system RelE/ParE family toxin [Desulfamplus sp.]|nr:type II toxin-antitoxin system RelE/ParE family toxin [Desulfamplus sp.]
MGKNPTIFFYMHHAFLVYKKEYIAIYIYGFNKNEQDNISDKELKKMGVW